MGWLLVATGLGLIGWSLFFFASLAAGNAIRRADEWKGLSQDWQRAAWYGQQQLAKAVAKRDDWERRSMQADRRVDSLLDRVRELETDESRMQFGQPVNITIEPVDDVSEPGEQVLNDIRSERSRQDRDWPLNTGGFAERKRLAILTEEVGEVARVLCGNGDGGDLREELIQVAAVAARWVECLDDEAAFAALYSEDQHAPPQPGPATKDLYDEMHERLHKPPQAKPELKKLLLGDNVIDPPPPASSPLLVPQPEPSLDDETIKSRDGCPHCAHVPGVLCPDCARPHTDGSDRINLAYQTVHRLAERNAARQPVDVSLAPTQGATDDESETLPKLGPVWGP